MLDTYLRPTIQKKWIDPLLKRLSSTLSPTAMTCCAAGCGMLAAFAIYAHFPWLAVVLLFFSGLADILDGSLARLQGVSSPQGAVLDIVSDRVVEGVVILGLYSFAPEERGGWCLLMLFSVLICVTSFLVVGVFSQNSGQKSFYYSPGLMERLEAFLFFIAMILLPRWFAPLAAIFTTLVFWTGFKRTAQFLSSQRGMSIY